MAFAILRTQKIKSSDVGGVNDHNTRKMDVPNADKELTKYNSQPIGTVNLANDIQRRIDETQVPVRKNSVLAIEHMMTASPEFFNYQKTEEGNLIGNVKRWQKFESECIKWLSERYGEDNVINVSIHKDENTPHLHAIVTPIIEKDVKWKNGTESGVKKEQRLSARDFLNGSKAMKEMQSGFAQHLQESGLELKRGIENSKAEHKTVKEFYNELKQAKEIETKSFFLPNTPEDLELNFPKPEKGIFSESSHEYVTRSKDELNTQLQSEVQKNLVKIAVQHNKELNSLKTALRKERGEKEKLQKSVKALSKKIGRLEQSLTKSKSEEKKWVNNARIIANNPNIDKQKVNEVINKKMKEFEESQLQKQEKKRGKSV